MPDSARVTKVSGGWNVPSPLPSSTDTVPVPGMIRFPSESKVLLFVTARSSRPSPVKSPATERVWLVPRRVLPCGLERAVAVAQQHRDVVRQRRRPGRAGRRR